jgi:prefoldin subunit 5
LNDLDEKFGVIEKRVLTLMARNKSLTDRISELERELLLVRREIQSVAQNQDKNQQIREKIANILSALNSISARKGD